MASIIEKLYGIQGAPAPFSYPDEVEIPGILNTHFHGRNTEEDDDGRAEMNIPRLAQVCEDAISIGNTKPPLITPARSASMLAKWRSLIPPESPLKIHAAGLIVESTTPEEVVAGYDKPDGQEDWLVMKMFIRAVSNAGGADVDDVSKIIPVIKAMTRTKFTHKKRPMALMIHAERKYNLRGNRINFLKRDAESMERDIPYIFKEVPEAKIIICHVKSAYALEIIRHFRSQGFDIRGEISPHYTQYVCDDLFEGPEGGTMLNCDIFCLPIFGTEEDREAVEDAMLSGEDFYHFGDDEACHLSDPTKPGGVKINNKGYVVGGQTQLASAVISYVAEKFIRAGKQHLLDKFLSLHGREAVGLPPPQTTLRLQLKKWIVPETIERDSPKLGKQVARVAMGGQERMYQPVSPF